MDKIKEMLLLQQELNNATNGENWEKGITKNGKIIDWKRCAYLECAELIESYPWKHWKNIDASPDYENIKIECVDIWHFVMSLLLQEYKINNLGSIEILSQTIQTAPNFEKFTDKSTCAHIDHYDEIAVVEKLLKALLCECTLEETISTFIDVAIQSDLNLDSLYQLYIGKNILNQFRQDHGYKEGHYIKIWNGREDNVIMQQILDANSTISPTELYNALSEQYPR